MSVRKVLAELKSMGSEKTIATMKRHGAPDDFYGVLVKDMQKIVKRVKVDQELAEGLYANGNGDAQYLAGLIADPKSIKLSVLKKWAKTASWQMVAEWTVAGVAADSPHGWKLGLEWIDAKNDETQTIGWNTLSGVVGTLPDDELDLKKVKTLLTRVKNRIHKTPDRVAYSMNSFVISVGSYIEPLHEKACETAEKIGKLDLDMGDTCCKVPHAPDYIAKVASKGRVGKKRKRARC